MPPRPRVNMFRTLEKLEHEYWASVDALAKQYRTRTLIPFCRRNKLKFLSGNNDYFFVTRDGNRIGSIRVVDDIPARLKRELFEVFAVLDTEVMSFKFGLCLSSYQEQE